MQHNEGQSNATDGERMRIKIERRPDAPSLCSWKGLGEPVVVVLLTAMVAFIVADWASYRGHRGK